MINIAIPTGRMMKECATVLGQLGLSCSRLEAPDRALIISEKDCRYLLAKPMDVPAYVHYGAADMALVGSDVLMERRVPLVELADTGAGRCRLVIAAPDHLIKRFAPSGNHLNGLKVATKYPNIATSFFHSLGVKLEVVHMHGSVELAPLLGISDCILDIVQSGETLKANGLKVIQEVAQVSMRLVASRRFTQTGWSMISGIMGALRPWKGRIYNAD